MTSTSAIILEYIIPIIGTILSNLQYLAPVRDLRTAVSNGTGLNSLNPTPWAFMMGKGLGWTGYGILTNNWFAFLSECPGFLIGCWLNLGAIKLLYLSHHKKEITESLVSFLAEGDGFVSKPPNGRASGESQAHKLEESTHKPNDTDPDIEQGLVEEGGDASRQRSVTLRRWGEIVWNVTSQKSPARIPHEYLVAFNILVWVVIFTALGYAGHANRAILAKTGPVVIGFGANLNQIVFYGAPLSRIWTVLSTRSSDTLHFPTMLFNTLNAALWFVWAFFGINDVFIYVPSGLGLFFGIVQFALWTVFPKSEKWHAMRQASDDNRRPSLSWLVAPEFLATVLPPSKADHRDEDDDETDRTVEMGMLDGAGGTWDLEQGDEDSEEEDDGHSDAISRAMEPLQRTSTQTRRHTVYTRSSKFPGAGHRRKSDFVAPKARYPRQFI